MRIGGFVVCVILALGCDESMDATDGGLDAGEDATTADTSTDASDASLDAPEDAGIDTFDAGVDAPDIPTPVTEWDGTLPDDGVCTPDGFCVVTPLPFALGMADVWAAAEDDVWVGGTYGALLHWDGTAWNGVFGTGGDIRRVHGCTSNDIWAVAAPSVLDVISVDDLDGFERRLLHWNGSVWDEELIAAIDVHCVSSTEVWAATTTGLQRFDGTAWEVVDTGFSVVPTSVTRGGEGRVFAVGRNVSDIATITIDGDSVEVHFEDAAGVRWNEIVYAFDELWAATSDGVRRWTGSGWEIVSDFNPDGLSSIAVTPSGMLAEADEVGRWSTSYNPATARWSGRVEARNCGETFSVVRGVGENYWAVTPHWNAGTLDPFCALAVAPPELGSEPSWVTQIEEVDLRGTLIDADQFLDVDDMRILIRHVDGRTVELGTLPTDGAGTPSFQFVGRTADGELWASRDGSVSARLVDGAWERHATVSPILRSVEGHDGATWGLGTDGVLASWTVEGGWVRSRDEVTRLVRFERDFWIETTTGIARWTESGWEMMDNDIDGEVVPMVIMGFGGPGRAWVQTGGGFTVARSTGTQWEGLRLEPYSTCTLSAGPPGVRLDPTIDAYGDELWTIGARFTEGEWRAFRSGVAVGCSRVEVNHGQVWFYDRLDEEDYVLRRNL